VEASVEATVGAIRDPVTLFVEQRSMLRTPAVLALRDSPGKIVISNRLGHK
jgi:hypothetical protein